MKKDTLVKKLGEKFYADWQETIANEVAEARHAVVQALKEKGTSLPAAVFALELCKHELLRAQLEEFLGHISIPQGSIPLSEKKPNRIEAAEQSVEP